MWAELAVDGPMVATVAALLLTRSTQLPIANMASSTQQQSVCSTDASKRGIALHTPENGTWHLPQQHYSSISTLQQHWTSHNTKTTTTITTNTSTASWATITSTLC
jgi:hypothetical protein